ncbi:MULTISPECIES: nucleotidyltransferase domain-containing protein [unclassified Clostridium]|uniref:nucleotidyltransferase family protein n=1 Tax=unclassified Clostridium TaxID=2614128 RepID=UPI00029812CD|nr:MULTISPECIES: nucleotidyltransferase domain-containing protein [unclassified Clostridium]EKQ56683.1 MAG: putative nucleotidyltransferase [Clostridium sp. Maddingley MBC34-26]
MEKLYCKEEIISLLKSKEAVSIFNKYDIKNTIIFGSINSDEFSEESDVDMAIIGSNKIKLECILELEKYLASLLNREIDVIDLRSDNLDLFMKIGILNNGKVIFTCDNNSSLEEFGEKLDRIYKENENFIYFRKKDVLS